MIEINQRCTGIFIISTTCPCTILHIHCHATLVHQFGDGIDLFGCAFGCQCVGHVGEIVRSAIVVHREIAILTVITMNTTGFNIFFLSPIVDNLRHSSSHATCLHMTIFAISILWAECIIILPLSPSSRQQWSYAIGQSIG